MQENSGQESLHFTAITQQASNQVSPLSMEVQRSFTERIEAADIPLTQLMIILPEAVEEVSISQEESEQAISPPTQPRGRPGRIPDRYKKDKEDKGDKRLGMDPPDDDDGDDDPDDRHFETFPDSDDEKPDPNYREVPWETDSYKRDNPPTPSPSTSPSEFSSPSSYYSESESTSPKKRVFSRRPADKTTVTILLDALDFAKRMNKGAQSLLYEVYYQEFQDEAVKQHLAEQAKSYFSTIRSILGLPLADDQLMKIARKCFKVRQSNRDIDEVLLEKKLNFFMMKEQLIAMGKEAEVQIVASTSYFKKKGHLLVQFRAVIIQKARDIGMDVKVPETEAILPANKTPNFFEGFSDFIVFVATYLIPFAHIQGREVFFCRLCCQIWLTHPSAFSKDIFKIFIFKMNSVIRKFFHPEKDLVNCLFKFSTRFFKGLDASLGDMRDQLQRRPMPGLSMPREMNNNGCRAEVHPCLNKLMGKDKPVIALHCCTDDPFMYKNEDEARRVEARRLKREALVKNLPVKEEPGKVKIEPETTVNRSVTLSFEPGSRLELGPEVLQHFSSVQVAMKPPFGSHDFSTHMVSKVIMKPTLPN